MKIVDIEIDGYKNLNNFYIHFDEGVKINTLIGENGSGKSNLLEALTIIFSNLYHGNKDIPFHYTIKIQLDSDSYEISNKSSDLKYIEIIQNNKRIPSTRLKSILPRTLFLYYSGITDRLINLANINDTSFNKEVKDGVANIKYLSYIGAKDFPITLLASHVFQNESSSKITKLLKINNLCKDYIKILLKRPSWAKSKQQINKESFWNATGAVKDILHKLTASGSLEIINDESAQIVINNYQNLSKIFENSFDLFLKFKLLLQSDILENVEYSIIKNSETISIQEISEGEKQISQLLCILDIMKEHRALFLLDEIDAYLHPAWQRKLTGLISEIDMRGQVIFTTHSPITIGKMKKETIHILKDGVAHTTSIGTYNRDVAELLEEVMDVSTRPSIIEELIKKFNQAALSKNREKAMEYHKTLKEKLSEEDPFWVSANILLKRLNG